MLLASSPAHAADQTLLLAVTVNGRVIDKVGTFTDRDGAIIATAQEWQDVGIKVPARLRPDDPVAASALPSLQVRVDSADQTIEITAADPALLIATIDAADPAANRGSVSTGTGFALDYDVTQVIGHGKPVATGTFDLRAFWSGGIASSGFIAYSRGGPGNLAAPSLLRLDTSYVISDPERLRQLRFGDFISGSLAWTRAVRLAGIQLTTNFALQPDLVTFPLPIIQGSAAVPSTLDLLVNGTHALTRPVNAGPFEVRQLPIVTGAGAVVMTLTDVAGHHVDVTIPFYASPALLAPGLSSYSIQAGAIRRNFGAISSDYGTFAASATYQRGLTRWTTIEATMEATPGMAMAGGGVLLDLFDLAQLSSAVAVSVGARAGVRLAIGVQRKGPVFSAGASLITASDGFTDIAAVSGEASPRLQLTANVGASFGAAGSLGLTYSAINRPASDLRSSDAGLTATEYQPGQHVRLASISYSGRIGRFAAYVSAYRNFTTGSGSGVFLGLSLPFGRHGSASTGVGHTGAGTFAQVQVTRPDTEIGEWGYQLNSTLGAASQGTGELAYRAGFGRLAVAVDDDEGKGAVRLNARGALVIAGGGIFAGDFIPDSFAIVDTGGLAHVRVLDDNREVGRTDGNGHLLVPALRAFDLNRIGIDPTDIPPDVTLATTELAVRPQDRSGTVVRFATRLSHGAIIRLADAAGAPVPVGSTAVLQANGIRSPVGYDGIAYIEGLGLDNELTVERSDGGRCAAHFGYTAKPGEIPTIGPVPCRLIG